MHKAQFLNNHPLLSFNAQIGNLQLLLQPGQVRMEFVCLVHFLKDQENFLKG